MSAGFESTYRSLLEAVSFAGRAHHGQMRKDLHTPYSTHVFRVCLVLAHVFGATDRRVLTAAVLHDTIEDTTTDFDDIEERWGAEIASWVALLSKDKRLEYDEREKAYCQALARAPWQVQLCKLADVFDNVLDIRSLSPRGRVSGLKNKRRYLEALRTDLKPEAAQAWQMVAALCDEMEASLAKDGAANAP